MYTYETMFTDKDKIPHTTTLYAPNKKNAEEMLHTYALSFELEPINITYLKLYKFA